MDSSATRQQPENRKAPVDMTADEFRNLGHQLVNEIAAFLESIQGRPVTPPVSPERLQALLRQSGSDQLPEHGAPADQLLKEASSLIFGNSLLSAHPRFWG